MKNRFVELNGVSKTYSGFPALQDVSFTIGKGDIFGYIGPNGAGKTTTIKSLIGLITDFEGYITIDGNRMPKDRDRIHKLIGYLPQKVAFQEWRTVDQALKTFGLLSGIEKDVLEERIGEVLTLVGIPDSRDRKIKELSGGNIQKVGLAQALLHRPKFLVFDEPLSGLDPASRYQVKEIIKELSKGETTVLFSSHILSDVQDIATKIGIINRGHLIDVGTLEELKRNMEVPKLIRIEFYDIVKDFEDIADIEEVDRVVPVDGFRSNLYLHEKELLSEASKKVLKKLVEMDYNIKNYGVPSPNLDELYMKYIRESDMR
ncbi:MAG: ABC transporter ATP-binding protein [Candidatus Saliniplasma sp.]